MVAVLQALLDRHAMLRLRVEDDGARRLVATVPEAGIGGRAPVACKRWTCCLMRRWSEARSRLNPAGGMMLSAVWAAVDAVSWC